MTPRFFIQFSSWLIVSLDFPSKVRAERVLQQQGEQPSKVRYRFNDTGIYVENGAHLKYEQVGRLIEDDEYFYYVKAVPKIKVTQKDRNVTDIKSGENEDDILFDDITEETDLFDGNREEAEKE